MSREVDRGEEDVADLVEDSLVGLGLRRPVACLGDRSAQLFDLVGELREDVLRPGVVETDGRSPPSCLARKCERGQRLGQLVEVPSRPSCSDLIASQRSRTRPAVRASASPKTCGCRRTSFS